MGSIVPHMSLPREKLTANPSGQFFVRRQGGPVQCGTGPSRRASLRLSLERIPLRTRGSTSASWDKTTLGISVVVMLIGLVVIVGWHAHIRAAVQVFRGLVPMQYNTALCFLALGAAGVGLSTRRRLLLLGGGSFAALMGAAVILEYATGRSFGIDTLFFYPWAASSADPGRMVITTAISFFLTGSTLVILAVRPRAYAIFGIVNSVPLSLALTSLIGYSFQITYVLPFSLGSQMALHTAVAFLAYGIAMLGYAWKYAERGPDGLPKWGAGIGVALLPVLLVGASALFPEQSWRVVPTRGPLFHRRRRADDPGHPEADHGEGGIQGPADDCDSVDPAPDVCRAGRTREAPERVGSSAGAALDRSHCRVAVAADAPHRNGKRGARLRHHRRGAVCRCL